MMPRNGPPLLLAKPMASTSSLKYTWDKPCANGTLESIVNQATRLPKRKIGLENCGCGSQELVPWFEHNHAPTSASPTMTMDAMVLCSNRPDDRSTRVKDSMPGLSNCVMGTSTGVGLCSGRAATQDEDAMVYVKRPRVAHVFVVPEWSSWQSVSGIENFGRDSQQENTSCGSR
ncbi:hypothetical protein MANES_09G128701v8 [Manihot esculenta]|uniref:Uncharacterized protein n=1 Tax=Manihot esculenta TaxID=3983 RepID=A0A2C9VBK4_MANES|nr:hypothetical protein MANES_09G128701v8 [Manihot esculenta]